MQRVNFLLAEALRDLEHGEQVMRREIQALKTAAERDLALLDQGCTPTDWTTHYAAGAGAGRQQILTGARTITRLAPLRRALLDTATAERVPPHPAT